MGEHTYTVQGHRFVIEIDSRPVNVDDRIFVALISRLEDGRRRLAVCQHDGRREVYGSSEAWALRNAEELLKSGAWRDEAVAVN